MSDAGPDGRGGCPTDPRDAWRRARRARPQAAALPAPAGDVPRPGASHHDLDGGSPGRRPWDFGYAPAATAAIDDDGGPLDVVIATRGAIDPEAVATAIARAAPRVHVEAMRASAPIFWLRARSSDEVHRADVFAALREAGIPVRYVASSLRPSRVVPPALDDRAGQLARPTGWNDRPASRAPDPETPGHWFLRGQDGGVAAERAVCGGGAGTRLAVVDDDALGVEQLGLDREILVMLERAPRSHAHGTLMVAWAVGCARPDSFRGVAPDASPRLYLIPKPGGCLLALPLAIVQAVSDGADVVVCATYVEGSTSPMLDDALDFARRFGRRGRGAAVVLPTGREASSVGVSLHASFSLGLAEPASDPRVFCVGPSARGEGWFLWRDRKGRSRPFANRGPAVRWLAPGDDMACPFFTDADAGSGERLFHAESSGASAIAAGVLLLMLASNPALRSSELDLLVTRTLDPIAPGPPSSAAPFADPSDMLPIARDRDGHNAKHGYGRMNAARACLAASDPIALALVLLGEDGAARAWHAARGGDPRLVRLYSRWLARWAVRALLADASLCHAVCALARHGRLLVGDETRRCAHGAGAVSRYLGVMLREFAASRSAPRPSARVRAELAALRARLDDAAASPSGREAIEGAFAAAADHVFGARVVSRPSNAFPAT